MMHGLLRHITLAGLVLVALGGVATASPEGEPPGATDLPEIPGVNAPDRFPRGCVDCHVELPEEGRDVRISTAIRQWRDAVDPAFLAKIDPFVPAGMTLKGRHPKVAAETADIPKSCLGCHSRTSKTAPPLGPLLHGLHLVGGADNHYLSMFQGACTHCHKLDATTGIWSLGGGPEKP